MTTRPFPGFDALYRFGDPLATSPYRGKIDFAGALTGAYSRGEAKPPQPLVVRQQSGGALRDVVWTGDGLSVLLSARIVTLLREQGLTGWDTYAVEVVDRDGTLRHDYVGLAVTGRCGPRDDRRGDWVNVAGRVYRRGYYFAEESWDGSDLFVVGASVPRFVTDRVRGVFRRAKIRNVQFVRADQFRRIAIDGHVDFSQSGPPPEPHECQTEQE
jgi:hypothetical protein